MRDGAGEGGGVSRNLFTPVSAITAVLCAGTGIAYFVTMRVDFYDPGPGLTFETVPWLGWPCALLDILTFGLLLWQASRIRQWDERERTGLSPHCGYDLRETPDRCPECGAEPPASMLDPAGDADHPRRHA